MQLGLATLVPLCNWLLILNFRKIALPLHWGHVDTQITMVGWRVESGRAEADLTVDTVQTLLKVPAISLHNAMPSLVSGEG